MEQKTEELVTWLSKEVVREIAPDELDLYQDIEEEFFKNPDAFIEKDTKKKEKMLGFIGSGIGEQFLTVTVLPIVLGVIGYVGTSGIEALKKEASKGLIRKIEKKFGEKESTDSHFSKDKIGEIREYAFNKAKSMGMDVEKAGILADSLIGKLVLTDVR